MKRVILVFLLVSSMVYGLDCSIEAGWQYKQLYSDRTSLNDFGDYFVEIGLYQDIAFVTFYGMYRNEMDKTHSFYFLPKQDYFRVGADLNLTDQLRIRLEHECYHPFSIFGEVQGDINGGHNQLSVKYSTGD